ncbi:MAG: apolipoprotein N-acyltransferase [SAR324 cluster bacterium]|nr:apolipoprotein N-acyltransferase [SAR324 cluster bacterium]
MEVQIGSRVGSPHEHNQAGKQLAIWTENDISLNFHLKKVKQQSMPPAYIKKLLRIPAWGWGVLSGLAIGFGSQAENTGFFWLFALFPLFLLFDRFSSFSLKKKVTQTFLTCYGVGAIGATISAPYMIHSINVFGHLPWGVAVFITFFVFGLEAGLTFFVLFGIPTLVIKRIDGWDIPVRLFYFLLLEPFYPKFFPWSLGGLTFSEVSWIAQTADLVGSWGLGLYAAGCNFLLLMVWRQKTNPSHAQKKLGLHLTKLFSLLLILGIVYGGWRGTQLQAQILEGEFLQIAAIQPNFSLQQLASNPDLAFSKRKRNIRSLLQDSKQALAKFPNNSKIPKLVVWPESVYPFPFFKDQQGRRFVENFAREEQSSILLSTIDWENTEDGDQQIYGISVLIGEDGKVKGRYNKIYLMPFGEFIPGAEIFPAYHRWIKNMVPMISEFTAGKEYTVYQIANNLRFSGAICFDAFSSEIFRNMVRNGAELIVNLSNLAWFGKTNASAHMELMNRWHAIENRVPFLYISNNGETMFLNPMGVKMSKSLDLFVQGSLSETIPLQRHYSFFREHKEWLQGGVLILLLLTAILGQWQGKIFTRPNRN